MQKGSDRSIQAELNQAQQAYRAGNLDVAESRINALYRQYPARADVLTARGILLAARGRPDMALDSFNESLKSEPDNLETLAWAAFWCLNLQRFKRAEELARHFVAIAPRNHRGYYLLANALRAQDRIGEGLEAIDQALALEPNDTDSMVTKARLLQVWQMPALAVELYQKAMSIRPTPAAGIELARVLMRDGHHEAALEIFKKIQPLMPPAERPYSPMAQAYTLLHRFDEAEVYWKRALQQSGDPVTTSQSRALMEIAAGRFSVAEELLFDLIKKNQDPLTSFSILTTGRKMKADDLPMIENMVSRASGQLTPAQHIDIHYALGKTFDDLRDYERAIGHYDEANRFCLETYRERRGFDRERTRALTDFLIELASPERLARLSESGLPAEFPLFVVGMMRSGTTLTETILSGHSRVKAGGEQAFWTERVIDFIFVENDRLQVEHATVMKFAQHYLDLVDPHDDQIRYVVDKNPGNIDLAGILHTALPNAKIMHLKRHPVDNLLSIWMTPLNAHVRYASDRSNLVFAYREYARLWKHFEQVLPPDRFRTFRYEDLTSEPEITIRSMLDYLDLEAEEACFAPERNARSVLTPSVYQVRQPIHRGSQERWRNYEPWLGEFAELLDDDSVS
jgi:tetratricopeptide (TPR) repeat protein